VLISSSSSGSSRSSKIIDGACVSGSVYVSFNLIARLYRRHIHSSVVSKTGQSSAASIRCDRREWRARTSDLEAWTKTMLTTIRISISEAHNQIRTGHQDIRTYFSDTAEPERNTNATLATATATIATTPTDRNGPRRTDLRQRPQQTRHQPQLSLWQYSCGNNHARDARRHGRTDNSSIVYLVRRSAAVEGYINMPLARLNS
jgi:hypothetical protein